MKRHGGDGFRRLSTEESEQNQANERKRMKLLQCAPEPASGNNGQVPPINPTDAPSFPNGHENQWEYSVIPEEKGYESPFENGSHPSNGVNNGDAPEFVNPTCDGLNSFEANMIPANLVDETVAEAFPMDTNNSSPPDLQPEPLTLTPPPDSQPVSTAGPSFEVKAEAQIDIPENPKPVTEENISHSRPKKSRVAKGSKSKVTVVSDLTSCQYKVTQLDGHADVVFCVDADLDVVLSSSGDTTVKVWSVEDGKELSNFAGHTDAVTSVVLMNAKQSENLAVILQLDLNTRFAISASMDCHIRLWSLLDGQEIKSTYTFNSITSMAYLESKMYAIIGTEGGKVELWDLHSSKLIHSLYAHTSAVTSITVQDCYVYSAGSDGAVKVFLFDDDELQPLYTRKRKQMNRSLEMDQVQWKSVAEHSDMLYLGDNTPYLKVLNWRLGQMKMFVNQGSGNGICEAVAVKDNILLSSFYDANTDTGGINAWELPGMKYLCTLTGDVQDICSLAVSSNETSLRVVSGGHQLLVWDFNFTQHASEESQGNFVIRKLEEIGSEVDEKEVEFLLNNLSAHSEVGKSPNKSWCNIS